MLELMEPGEGGLEECWKLAFLGIDRLLNDFGFELSRRLTVMKEVRDSFGKEFRVDSKAKQQLGARLRKERVALEALLQADDKDEHPLAPGLEILQQRSERQRPITMPEQKSKCLYYTS